MNNSKAERARRRVFEERIAREEAYMDILRDEIKHRTDEMERRQRIIDDCRDQLGQRVVYSTAEAAA